MKSPFPRSVWVLLALSVACSPKTGASKGNPIGKGDAVLDGSIAGSGGAGSVRDGGGGGDVIFKIPDAAAIPADAKLSADSGCEAVTDTRPDAPTVLIVLDRSRSMYVPPDVDRWNPAVTAIKDLTKRLEGQVRFGLLEFPSPSVPTIQQLCAPGELIVPPALDTSDAIATSLAGAPLDKIGGATPTAAALAVARTTLAGISGSSFVLLVTDGAPNCNATLDEQTCACTSPRVHDCTGAATEDGGLTTRKTPELCLDDDATVAAVSDLTKAGVKTFVVGYDASGFGPTLDAMAAAGGSSRTTFFPVSDGTGLAAAFESISAYVVSCTFELSEAPKDDRYVSVAIDGLRIERKVGWKLSSERTVELIGSTCSSVSDGKPHDILVVRECAPVVR